MVIFWELIERIFWGNGFNGDAPFFPKHTPVFTKGRAENGSMLYSFNFDILSMFLGWFFKKQFEIYFSFGLYYSYLFTRCWEAADLLIKLRGKSEEQWLNDLFDVLKIWVFDLWDCVVFINGNLSIF